MSARPAQRRSPAARAFYASAPLIVFACVSFLAMGRAEAMAGTAAAAAGAKEDPKPDHREATRAAPGGSTVAKYFDARDAWETDSILASPAFAGRKSGTPGDRAAEEWIAAQYERAGLSPGMPGGSWYDPFPVVGGDPRAAELELLDGAFGKVRFLYGDDFTLMLDPAAGDVTAEAVLVGYGFDAPAKGRDDYAGCDLRGKIAVIIRGRPDDGQNWDREFMRTHTFAAARAHGARAVLFSGGPTIVNGAALMPEVYDPRVPAAYVNERFVRLLLRETGTTLEEMQEKLKKSPFPLATDKRVHFVSAIRGGGTATAENVVGMLRGSDPSVGGEVVVIGGHLDHLGLDAAGRLYGGANDNASGSSVVLGIARAIHESGWRPRRSILFLAFSGEEMGLLGSRAFTTAAHMPVDSTHVVAMINLDMVGMGDGSVGMAGGIGIGEPYFRWRGGLDSTEAAAIHEGHAAGPSSDFASFMDHGIPVISVMSHGEHRHYHDFEDRARYIDPKVLDSVGRNVASVLQAIADDPNPLATGFGSERIILDHSFQVPFDARAWEREREYRPAAARSNDDGGKDRKRLSADGAVAGRIFLCDPPGCADATEPARALGAWMGLAASHPWLAVSGSIASMGSAHDEMRTAVLPAMRIACLDRLGEDLARSLCAAGIAAAVWPPQEDLPTRATCAILSSGKRPLITSSRQTRWAALAARENGLKLVVTWDRSDQAIPQPPDSTMRDRVLLVVPVRPGDGIALANQVVDAWGERHVHVDVTPLLAPPEPDVRKADAKAEAEERAGPIDPDGLLFIRQLWTGGWPKERIEAVLGGNLRRF